MSPAIKAIYAIRDTAVGADIATGIFTHVGEALAWLSSHVVGMQRISFELYEIGTLNYSDSRELSLEPAHRRYIMSAHQAILDSHHEEVEDLLDSQE